MKTAPLPSRPKTATKSAFFFLFSQGLVDLDSEIAKCDKKLSLATLNADKLRKIEAQPDYETVIPETVRAANSDKVSNNTHIYQELTHISMILYSLA